MINISKIKDGLFTGNRIAGTSLEIIIQFKISHMINVSGSQVVYNFSNIGIKYLTLNWAENPSSNIVYIKEDIVDKIVSFIDDSFKNGEGLLAFSLRGQNRVCVVIIIYLMKKYNWSLKKCLDYLNVKKTDVAINKNYLNQLTNFETRLVVQNKTQSVNWSGNNLKDSDEILMRNTYVNEIELAKSKFLCVSSGGAQNKLKHISWADNSKYGKKFNLISLDIDKDLYFQKNVKDISQNLKMKPLKSSNKSQNSQSRKKPSKIFLAANINSSEQQENDAVNNILISENKTVKQNNLEGKDGDNHQKIHLLKNVTKEKKNDGICYSCNNNNINGLNEVKIDKENINGLPNNLTSGDENYKMNKLINNSKEESKPIFFKEEEKIKGDNMPSFPNKNEHNINFINVINMKSSTEPSSNKIHFIHENSEKSEIVTNDDSKNFNINFSHNFKTNINISNNSLVKNKNKYNNFINDKPKNYSLYLQGINKLPKRSNSSNKKDRKFLAKNNNYLINGNYYLGRPESREKSNKKNNENNIIPSIKLTNNSQNKFNTQNKIFMRPLAGYNNDNVNINNINFYPKKESKNKYLIIKLILNSF